MLCKTAINTSNTIRTQTGAAEGKSSGLDTNSCYYVITVAFNYGSLYAIRKEMHVICRLTAKNRDQLRTLYARYRVRDTFSFCLFHCRQQTRTEHVARRLHRQHRPPFASLPPTTRHHRKLRIPRIEALSHAAPTARTLPSDGTNDVTIFRHAAPITGVSHYHRISASSRPAGRPVTAVKRFVRTSLVPSVRYTP